MIAKADFDVALMPGLRQRLAAGYERLRELERRDEAAWTAGGNLCPPRPCPACGGRRTEPRLQREGFVVVDCAECGLTFSAAVWTAAEAALRLADSPFSRAYLDLRQGPDYARLERARNAYVLSALGARRLPGRLLEIGAATGVFVRQARAEGWDALGIEAGVAARKLARQSGTDLLPGVFPDDMPADLVDFDVVVLLDVLEHVAEPLAFLAQVRRRLAGAGALVVQTPNMDSLIGRLEGAASANFCPGHWTYFTRASLTAVLDRAGFRPLLEDTYITELDRVLAYPQSRIAQALGRDAGGEGGEGGEGGPPPPPTPDLIYQHGLGNKLFAIFEPSP